MRCQAGQYLKQSFQVCYGGRVSRTPDEGHRLALLDAILGYVAEHGVADLSLRPLAKAVGSSPRVLLYYFGSKERMVVEVLAQARARQRVTIGALLDDRRPESSTDVCRLAWAAGTSPPESLSLMRLFFAVYALALRHPDRYPGFLEGAVGDWLTFLAQPHLRAGVPEERALARATGVLAFYRGLMLDLCATGDRARAEAALEDWIALLELAPSV